MGRRIVRELDELTRSLRREATRPVQSFSPARARGCFVTHYEIEEILAGAEGVGPPPPRSAAAALVRVAGAVKHVPGARGLVERTPVRGLLELHRVHDLFRRMNRSDKVFVGRHQRPGHGRGLRTITRLRSPLYGRRRLVPHRAAGDDDRVTARRRRQPAALARPRRLAGPGDDARGPHPDPGGGAVPGPRPRHRSGRVAADAGTDAAHRLARRSPEAVRALKRSVYEGSAGGLETGMATERKLFLWAGGSKRRAAGCGPSPTRSARRGARPGPTPRALPLAAWRVGRPWLPSTKLGGRTRPLTQGAAGESSSSVAAFHPRDSARCQEIRLRPSSGSMHHAGRATAYQLTGTRQP